MRFRPRRFEVVERTAFQALICRQVRLMVSYTKSACQRKSKEDARSSLRPKIKAAFKAKDSSVYSARLKGLRPVYLEAVSRMILAQKRLGGRASFISHLIQIEPVFPIWLRLLASASLGGLWRTTTLSLISYKKASINGH